MMFDTVARLLSSIPTFLFPVFASYKALKTSDPALLAPWLMYWVVLACALLFESWAGFVLVWFPLYSWIRLGFLLYLILPQTQGAKVLYQTHVHPFLQTNEHAIDDFISSAHDRAKAAGVEYLKTVIELIKERIFGLPPKDPSPPASPSHFSYTQNLIARFNLPAARQVFPVANFGGTPSTASDFYGLLASAVTAASTQDPASTSVTRDLCNSGTLIPPTVSRSERLSFISAQRERLTILLSALEKEASTLQTESVRHAPPSVSNIFFDGSAAGDEFENSEKSKNAITGLNKSRSEADFVKIEADSGAEESDFQRKQADRFSTGGWMPWSWGAHADATEGDTVINDAGAVEDKGKSSSVDA